MFQQTDHRARMLDANKVFVSLRSPGNPSSPPLFCVHPSGRDVGIYRKLARHLKSDVPVIGIRPGHMDRTAANPVNSLNELAAWYSELIDRDFPSGPIRLLGFSLGGFTATIMSSILRAHGREVSFLGLIDSDLRWSVDLELAKGEFTLRMHQLAQQLQDIGVMPSTTEERSRVVAAKLAEMSFGKEVTATQILQKLKSLGHPASRNAEPMLIQLIESMALHCRLLLDYSPPKIKGPVHMWWPTEPAVAKGVRAAQWQTHVDGEIVEQSLKGSHYEVMRMPSVRNLAQQINILLPDDAIVQSVK